MSRDGESSTVLSGERRAAMIGRVASLASRLRALLAGGLVGVLGLLILLWYYTHAVPDRGSPRNAKSNGAAQDPAVSSEPPLRGLGRIDAPLPPPPPAAAPASDPVPLREIPLEPGAAPAAGGATKSAAEIALERRLAGVVYAPPAAITLRGSEGSGPEGAGLGETDASDPARGGDLAHLLRPSEDKPAYPRLLPTRRLLLPKGAFVDCTLETAIDSTLPGVTTCVTATDTFGADGRVVLLERGTKLVGETRGQVQQGAARVFVAWNEARTPDGVVVPLASPGTDELGRSGLAGEVERHFWQRFGAALLISVIDGAADGAVQAARGGTVVVNPTGTAGVTTEALHGTVGIPPTVTKRQGDRIQILVARDIDFRSVYELVPAAAAR